MSLLDYEDNLVAITDLHFLRSLNSFQMMSSATRHHTDVHDFTVPDWHHTLKQINLLCLLLEDYTSVHTPNDYLMRYLDFKEFILSSYNTTLLVFQVIIFQKQFEAIDWVLWAGWGDTHLDWSWGESFDHKY
jgi:hypothetical protein